MTCQRCSTLVGVRPVPSCSATAAHCLPPNDSTSARSRSSSSASHVGPAAPPTARAYATAAST
eukprot:CAMPEP_0185318022 /NCGR_PEP_ID=MMETSP1363-20130426/48359_1 /TAXON_ID=38817 /ORGANISM="Gephyrocapsa oceanica, Strain RCC1303" /LENGTH=62 /DNA_ID=CAMNT_0027916297 /DNA_START=17 /DNA_END=202 /DNA_ORIENTATION=-